MKKHAKAFAFVLSLLILFGFSACSPSWRIANMLEVVSSGIPFTETTIVDHAGRSVIINRLPQKIISADFSITSTIIALGISDKLAGIENGAKNRPLYAASAPALLEVPSVIKANNFDIESCIAIEPDLVIAPIEAKDRIVTLEELGVTVVLVSHKNHEQIMDMFDIIGKATGTQSKAKELASYYKSELDAVAALASSSEKNPLVFMGGKESLFSATTENAFAVSFITSSGAENGNELFEYNPEDESANHSQLLSINPAVIIIPPDAAYTKEDIIASTPLSALTAVRNGAIYTMPKLIDDWTLPSTASTLGLRWMLYTLHNELYSKEELEVDISRFYSTFYSISEIDFAGVFEAEHAVK